MPTTLDLINTEQLANTLFLISTLYAYASGSEAAKAELEKQQVTTASSDSTPSNSTSAATKSAEQAWLSTWYSVVAYILYTISTVARKINLERDIQAGTTNASIVPSIIIILGFALSTIGTIMRLPAIQKRIQESRVVVL